jgi:hypothetical protein
MSFEGVAEESPEIKASARKLFGWIERQGWGFARLDALSLALRPLEPHIHRDDLGKRLAELIREKRARTKSIATAVKWAAADLADELEQAAAHTPTIVDRKSAPHLFEADLGEGLDDELFGPLNTDDEPCVEEVA